MSEGKFSQLRFDISEKVRLHPQQPGIETLLELDLHPDVEIRDEGKHLKIQGYLRLNGVYLGDSGSNPAEVRASQYEVHEDIAYVIPVEITIPADRAELGNISAEVETFDYSVISPFELQVEAILTIDGLLSDESKQGEEIKHMATNEVAQQPSFSASPAASEKPKTHKDETQPESEFKEYLGVPITHNNDGPEADEKNEAIRPELHLTTNRDTEEMTTQPSSVEYLHDLWNKKRMVEEEKVLEGSISKDQFVMEKETERNETEVLAAHTSEETCGEAEWAHWMMRSKSETFTPIKMVISQKDESIDTIADKYGLPVGKLLSFNRLKDDHLQEGQVICVP